MTSLTDRLRQHAQLHQQCTVQDDEQKTFADDLLAAAAEIERLQTTLADSRAYVERLKGRIDEVKAEIDLLRIIVEGAAAADEFLENPEAIYRLARIARAALGAT